MSESKTEIIYGRWAVMETLRAGRRTVQQLVLAEGIEEKSIVTDLIAEAQQRKRDRQARTAPHDGRSGEGREPSGRGAAHGAVYLCPTLSRCWRWRDERKEKPFILILDLLQDPQNVGTLLRVADAVGAHGVVIQDRRGVGITAAVVNASSGAAEHLNVVQVTNLVNAMRKLKELGCVDGRAGHWAEHCAD